MLEGDELSRPVIPVAAEKYVLGPEPPVQAFGLGEGELPAAYGTGKLLLAARDPHCLYAHWDLTEAQQRRYNTLSAHRHLRLRVYRETIAGQPATEAPLHPESRHGFVRVEHAGAKYLAQLGCYQPGGDWVTLVTSDSVATPPETVAEDKTLRWATIPTLVSGPTSQESPLETAVQQATPSPASPGLGKSHAEVAATLGSSLADSRLAKAQPNRPEPALAAQPAEWTPAHQHALEEVVGITLARQRKTGSAEITELLQGRILREIARPAPQHELSLPFVLSASPPGQPGGEAPGISSQPGGERAGPHGFWFSVNAELILYGATEPGARVTVGGWPLQLRPDGSFSCRFALPDGHYDLAVAAVSARDEARRADLAFSRHTEYPGEVEAQPQDQALQPPAAGNIPTFE